MRTALIALAAIVVTAVVARGDPTELDRRLEAAGFDGALGARVHDQVDRAVAFLVKRQQPDGSFVEGNRGDHDVGYPRFEVTVLCALALRHAGTPAATAAAARAGAWLFGSDASAPREMETRVESAGLALALLADAPGRQQTVARLAGALVRAIEPKEAWWDYYGPGGDDSDPALKTWAAREHRYPNLMASHLAVLGLFAASRRTEIDVPTSIWTRHGLSLVDAQTRFDSWDIHRGPPMQPFPSFAHEDKDGWVLGTLLGFSDLVLCARALETAKDAPVGARPKLSKAIDRGRKALARDAGRTLAAPLSFIEIDPSPPAGIIVVTAPPGSDGPGAGPCYRLAALAKACIFAGLESVDGFAKPEADRNGRVVWKATGKKVSWYATGVNLLLEYATEGGGWAPSGDPKGPASESETAWGILFLVRYASAFHPTAPCPPDAPPVVPKPAMGG